MKTLTKMILTSALAISANAFAKGPGASEIFGARLKPKSTNTLATKINHCADFTGTYVGKCNDETEDRIFKVQQIGCKEISLDSQRYLFNSIRSESNFTDAVWVSASEGMTWDESGEKINYSILGHVKFNDSKVIPVGILGEMSKIGDKLIVKGMTGDLEIACEYQKQ